MDVQQLYLENFGILVEVTEALEAILIYARYDTWGILDFAYLEIVKLLNLND